MTWLNMCGISGILSGSGPWDDLAISAMTDVLHHRGPDSYGYWTDRSVGVQLGHRRLSILDLSPAGHQPMLSQSNRYVITFNGEIYNYRSLAQELEGAGYSFVGGSDTEVMLAAFERWGVYSALERFNGMFAFGLWDRDERTLYLARDRIGEKPLFYGWQNGFFLFASELKAILAHPRFLPSVDPNAAALALRFGYITAPWSIYKGIYKLLPGSVLKISAEHAASMSPSFAPDRTSSGSHTGPQAFWPSAEMLKPTNMGAPDVTTSDYCQGSISNLEHAATHLEALLSDAVQMRMISDVAVGAFLSGGVDSSMIAALMQQHSRSRIQTFAIGFNDRDFNEALFAKQVAAHLGTDHHELYVSPRDISEVIPLLTSLNDEPFGDASQIPTYLVSKLSRQSVSVTLSGDGGDELFAGYERYGWADRYWSRARYLPHQARLWMAEVLEHPGFERVWSNLCRMLPQSLISANPVQKLNTLAGTLRCRDRLALYRHLITHWHVDLCTVSSDPNLPTLFDQWSYPDAAPFMSEMMAIDLRSYLPDDIMAKVDRASMAVSLEVRAPFLDHRIVEFASSLPLSYKVGGEGNKLILKRILNRYLPERLTARRKMGFSIPLAKWLRCELRPWAEELLSTRSLVASGLLNPVPIRKRWLQHLAKTHNWENQLWDVLMLQAWLRSESSRGG